MSALGLHGSSLNMYALYYPSVNTPLIGTPKGIRSDEWITHSPAILNQVFRQDLLSADNSAVGPGGASLLYNVPANFLVMAFRPQFWSFFILPPEQAFSVYWQFKTLLLLAGLFSIILLVTEQACISAVLALFFYFSPHIQWQFSWPSL